jgi:hypothetical protein
MSRSNRGQMIDQALQRVGNNSPSLKIQARIRLNRVLQDLHQGWDWPFLWTSASLLLPANGVIILPTDFVKPEDDQSLLVTQYRGQAMRRPVQEIDHRTFEQHRGVDSGSGGCPQVWTLDYTTMTGQLWPRPAENAQGSLRYKFLPPDVLVDTTSNNFTAYDTDIPSFPWDSFLTDQIAEWAMAYEDDPRRAEQIMINEELLKRLRGATWPDRSYPSNVPLDPLFFSTPTWGSGRD